MNNFAQENGMMRCFQKEEVLLKSQLNASLDQISKPFPLTKGAGGFFMDADQRFFCRKLFVSFLLA